MPTESAAPASRVILHNATWRLYDQLLPELGESPGTRITYDSGTLQIMVASAGHDNLNRTLAEIVALACEETGTDYAPFGSTTFKREDLLKGFEPDSCFYFAQSAAVRDKDELNMMADPAPELVIEVDVTSNSLNRLPIFAAFGTPEVWRYAKGRLAIFALRNSGYVERERSVALPVLTAAAVSDFMASSRTMQRIAWLRSVREWIRVTRPQSH